MDCSIQEFKYYIESQFTKGMTWDNYGNKEGQWSLDHIICCELFDLSDPKQQSICFRYKNMRPIWHIDNIIKNDSISNNRRARDLTREEKINYLKELNIII